MDRPSWYGYNHKHGEKVVDLGCGRTKVPGSIGVDCFQDPAVDVLHDLDVFPYPFGSDTIDAVYLNHCIEHLDDPRRTLEECLRIVRRAGNIFITVPHVTNLASFGDATHRRFFSYRAIPGLANSVAVDDKRLGMEKAHITTRIPCFGPLINLSPRFWEDYLCFIMTGRALYYRFAVRC